MSEQKGSRYHVQYNEGKEFYAEMKNKYPMFDLSAFKRVVQIAYPIAFLEIDVLERSIKDFSIVEKTILKMAKNGNCVSKIIAKELGLTEIYVEKIIALLQSYAHLDDDRKITKLGQESLEQEKAIKMNREKQIIQVDAVTAKPVYVKDFINEQAFEKPGRIGRRAHIKPSEGIDIDKLKNSLQSKDNYSNYTSGEYGTHVNAEEITDVKLVDLKYAKAYYLMNYNKQDMIVCKSYDKTTENMDDRFRWRILYASDFDVFEKFGIEEEGYIDIERSMPTMNEFRKTMENEKKTEEDIYELLNDFYKFYWNNTVLSHNLDNITIEVNKGSFQYYDKVVLKILESLAEEGTDYLLFEELYGKIIILSTKDERLMKLANNYNGVRKRDKRKTIMDKMDERANSESDFFVLLEKVLTEIKNDK